MAEAGMRELKVELPEGHALMVSDSEGAKGMPVVFLNSLAADHRMWRGVRDRLERHTLAYDARGHGASDTVAGDASIADLGRDAFAVMDAAGIEQAVLCGLSIGGLTAMWMAAEAPKRVAGLVLANTATTFPPATMWRDRAKTARAGNFESLVEPSVERWLTDGFRAAHAATANEVRRMIAGTDPEGYAACCAALAEADTSEALKSYGGPVSILAGAHDRSVNVSRAEEMRTLAPQATLEVLNAAHVAAIEVPAAFAGSLDAFSVSFDVRKEAGL